MPVFHVLQKKAGLMITCDEQYQMDFLQTMKAKNPELLQKIVCEDCKNKSDSFKFL